MQGDVLAHAADPRRLRPGRRDGRPRCASGSAPRPKLDSVGLADGPGAADAGGDRRSISELDWHRGQDRRAAARDRHRRAGAAASIATSPPRPARSIDPATRPVHPSGRRGGERYDEIAATPAGPGSTTPRHEAGDRLVVMHGMSSRVLARHADRAPVASFAARSADGMARSLVEIRSGGGDRARLRGRASSRSDAADGNSAAFAPTCARS